MTGILAAQALTADGWADNVRIAVEDGRITSLTADSVAESGDYRAGIVIPGLANVHSHAFQRVMAGHTEYRGPQDQDNFWSWRKRMYALAECVDAGALQAIATQAYREMLATGYTSVAEFHYLHNEPGDQHSSSAMFEAIVAAANATGIRLIYVPVLYERAGFNDASPNATQQRFARTVDQLIEHFEMARASSAGHMQTGIGVHSLRAVTPESLHQIAAVAQQTNVPMHLHIAEQQREVEECVEVLGARPVAWLLDHCEVNQHWCLVHATHLDESEVTALARSGAVVGLCPSTEANLGDGLFPLKSYLQQGGHIGIGSDSHVSINPFEELRWLEYGQRLITQSRNVAAVARPQTGRSLFEMALIGGALACGRQSDQLTTGAPADLIVLDDDSPMLAGHTTTSFLDALVFSGFTLPIDRVMVAGDWRVVDGSLPDEAGARAAYANTVQKLQLSSVNL